MSMEEIEQRQAHFKEFGEFLVRRHGQNYYSSYDNQSRVTVDETAVRFGRYLRAARSNTGLSIKELAIKAKLSEATLIALEQGLILACDIKPSWLKQLADILAENFGDFNILLGRKNPKGPSNARWFTERWVTRCQNLLSYSLASMLSKPVYGAVSVILLCFAVSAFLYLGAGPFEQPHPKQEVDSSTIIVEPKRQPDLFRADPGLESQAFVEPSQAQSLPTQTRASSGIARRY